ncbi:PAAR domain-containing protein [Lysobacter sp. H21R4]|uniref:PAAR domain-containing protein n=1 Tax=Lysobacter sp. H21R4 TaxID=2781021 RepID=UPI001886B45E|nr:PAAR domain-containing protein [Lysobacter sp. H21R4]QOY63436.1 PAAR domain-containing protein [Lysobacter sp. H21R4]
MSHQGQGENMTRMWIVLGDATSSGGTVISGSPFTDIDGKPVARINDMATCPTHKGTFPIVDGDPTTIIDGQAVALHGSSIACGCKVLAVKQMRVFLDDGAGSATAAVAPEAAAHAHAAKANHNGGPSPAALTICDSAFDEQIRFVGPTGSALSNIRYVLQLEDGTEVDGVTDEDGRTRRVTTSAPLGITKAELVAPTQASGCCGALGLPSQTVEVALAGARTNATAVGSSVHEAVAKAEDRGLTSGEVAMLRQVFGNSVDYKSVKLHNHGYWLLFGFQPDNTATAPNGDIYLPGKLFSIDFSLELDREQRLLVHEMTHVWQYQLGYPIKRVRGPRPNMTYEYTLDRNKRLCDYNMEAQGNIIADYYLLRFRQNTDDLYESKYRHRANLLALYEGILRDFLITPDDSNNLPQVTK